MKRIFIGLAILLIIAILVFGGILGFISMRGIPNYEPEEVNFSVNASPEKIEKGWRLSSMVCNHCHTSYEHSTLAGRKVEDIDPAFGSVYSANITQHPEKGIGNWTDSQLAYFIRTGVRPNGSYAPAYMPKFPLMSDDDLESIIAFLRSDNDLVKSTDYSPPKTEPSLMTKVLCNTVMKPFDYPNEKVKHPSMDYPLKYGEYLSTAVLGCFQCHSADFKTVNELVPEESEGFFGGGNRLYDMEGKLVYSPNITFHEESGIGKWSKEQFIQAVRFAKTPDGRSLKYPMIPYSALTEEEVSLIYDYLKTVKRIDNKVVVHPES